MPADGKPVRFSGFQPGLDGVRGLAILLVMGVHFVGDATPHNRGEWLAVKLGGYGLVGVDLFFVLSGFLITGLLLDSKPYPGYYRNFYARRFLRIFPLYYMVLAALFLILPRLMTIPPALEAARAQQGWLWSYLANFRIAAASDWSLTYVSHFWSLAIEEHFYLVWPLVVYLVRRETLERLCVAVIVAGLALRVALVLSGVSELSVSVLTPCRVDTLCTGALLAAYGRRDGGAEALLARAVPFALGLAAIIVPLATFGAITRLWIPVIHQVRTTLNALFFAALTLISLLPAERNAIARLFQGRVLRVFGKYSYGLYVYHGIIAYRMLELRAEDRFGAMFGGHSRGMIVQAVFGVALSLLVSVASYELFEKRFLSLKRYFETARPAPVTVAAVPAPAAVVAADVNVVPPTADRP